MQTNGDVVAKRSKASARRPLARAVLLAITLLAWSRRAASQAGEVALPLTLDWSAPAGCPTRERVVARVKVILGNSTNPRGAAAVRATASPSASGKWHVSLFAERGGDAGIREFEAESCDAAADATALIVSLLIDPTVAGADVARASEATPPPTAPPNPAPPEPPSPAPVAPVDSPPRPPLFAVRAALAGDVGTFSPASVGGELMIAVTPRHLRFELAGSYWLATTPTLPGTPSEGASIQLATLGLRAAYVFSGPHFAFAPLVGVEGDRMSATGIGGTSQLQQTATWVAVDLGATGSWFPIPTLPAISLSLTLEGVVAVEKLPSFVATGPGGGLVAQPFPIAGRAFLGVEYRFL